jgi:S1-C subfamily serine protease
MNPSPTGDGKAAAAANRRTLFLFAGLVILVGLLVWPSLMDRLHYARVRAELRALRDAAAVAELTSVGKIFTTLARRIGPTVVNVTSKRRLLTVADEIAALRGLAPVGVTDEQVGSGVITGADGVIVTNYHVVANSEVIDVALVDAATDLAVLRIDAKSLPVAAWEDSDDVEVGQMVWAIGNPFGLDRTLTYGIVSAVGRRGVLESPYQEFLQTDAAINPGNSGGPLVDVHGHVVGITTAIVGKDYTGIGFAIPSNVARQVSEEILRSGHVERGYLGLALRATPPGSPGVEVVGVEPRSPAAVAGIRTGDVILRFDDDPLEEPAEFVLLLTRAQVGTSVMLEVARAGGVQQIAVDVGRRPRND